MGICRAPHPEVLWARQYHASSGAATGAAFDTDGTLAVGGYVFRSADLGFGRFDAGAAGDAVVTVLEADGTPRWARTFPGDAAQVTEVVFDRGTVWAAGVFGRSATVLEQHLTSAGTPDAFLAHLGGSAERLDVLHFSGPADNRILAVLPEGDEAFVGGYYSGSAALGTTTIDTNASTEGLIAITDGGGVRWARVLSELGARVVHDAARMPEGDVVITGFYERSPARLPPSASGDAFVARVDSVGSVEWAVGLGGAGSDEGLSIAADGRGNLYVGLRVEAGMEAGTFSLDGPGVVLLRLGSMGEVQWGRALNHQATSDLHVAVDAAGNAISVFSFDGELGADGLPASVARGRDVFIATHGRDGAALSGMLIGSEGDEWSGGLASDGCGGFAVVGSFAGELSTDAGTLTSEHNDGFITRWTQ